MLAASNIWDISRSHLDGHLCDWVKCISIPDLGLLFLKTGLLFFIVVVMVRCLMQINKMLMNYLDIYCSILRMKKLRYCLPTVLYILQLQYTMYRTGGNFEGQKNCVYNILHVLIHEILEIIKGDTCNLKHVLL